MDIKEIALKVGAQGLSIEGTAHKFCMLDFCSKEVLIEFAEAIISAYKADLLKGVGEPVLYAEFAEDGGWLGDASEYADHLEEPHALFTSEQVATAVLKATKPLEERRCEICGYAEHHREHTSCLRIQLAKVEQLLQVAQGRCDELEEKLAKAEQRVAEIEALRAEVDALRQNAASVLPELVAVALAACDAVDDLIEKWYATREAGCLPNQVIRARGASKLLRAIALEGTK